MIFVTLGTTNNPFPRLSAEVLSLVVNHGYDYSDFIIQSGVTKFSDSFTNKSEFYEKNLFDYYLSRSEFVISHAGVGTVMSCLIKNKIVIACPRYNQLNEHVDDHQLEFCEAMKDNQYLLALTKGARLVDLVRSVKLFRSHYIENNDVLSYLKCIIKD